MPNCPKCGHPWPAQATYCGDDGTPLDPSVPVDPLVGKVLEDRYQILAPLGAGGVGAVYRAKRLRIEKIFAVKFLRGEFANDPEFLQRFEREAVAMSRLSHLNCVSLVDFGVAFGMPYIVMELFEGGSLADEVVKGRLDVARAIRIARQILAGLAHAHALGIVHRDLKPANVMLVHMEGIREHVKILDFGFAKMLEADGASTLTASGIVLGSPSYMAPEQARGGTIDHRVDLYALSVILFEMVTGTRPFVADDPLEVMRMQVGRAPPRPREVAPAAKIPPRLEAAILRGLAKTPGERFKSADEFLAAIEAAAPAAGSRGAPTDRVALAPRGGGHGDSAEDVALAEFYLARPIPSWPRWAVVAALFLGAALLVWFC